jgi:2-keto-4-pentenoate hydratase/2-oxohepta-3-ene-1,7-dioic acid hydratase in catechol pathway
MRLATFVDGNETAIGVVAGDELIDLRRAAPELPREMTALLAAGPDALARVRKAAGGGPRLPLASVRLRAPVVRPPKVLAVGLNYASHARETGREPPAVPIIFNKQATAVTGPYDPIHAPPESAQLDYEGELAVIIGRRCRRVSRERAPEVIAGYTVANDVSVRDWQLRVPTMTMGKSWDTHCPLGPWLVTGDEIDPHDLTLRTLVNGELRQSASTGDLIFDCFALVEHLTTAFTLEPGDVISTGTPAGVALAMSPPRWLRPGDVVRVEIDGIGAIENPIVVEPVVPS